MFETSVGAIPNDVRLRRRPELIVRVEPLAQLLRNSRTQAAGRQRELEVLSMDFIDDAVVLNFKANRMGFFEFTVGSGITATVHVKSVLM